jgi:DNA-binding MarR family transcriptional regulator
LPPVQLLPVPVATEEAETLRRVASRLARRLRTSAAGGLTPSQLSCLASVVRHGPLRVGDLATREALNPTSLSRIVGRLEEVGYLSRRPDPADRRGAVLAATPAGERTLAVVELERTTLLLVSLERLDAGQVAAIRAAVPALEALVEALPRPGGSR